MNRRFFLQGVGGALLAAPLLTSLRSSVRASDPAPPRRSVLFHSPCGCLTTRWFPKVDDGPLAAADLAGTTLEVLTPYVDKLLVPRGLRAINAFARPQSIDPHKQAIGSKLTCALLEESGDNYPVYHSLDHEIARQVNPDARGPLVLTPLNSGSGVYQTLSYSAPLTPLVPSSDPLALYAELTGVSAPEAEYRLRRQQSVIDAVRDDLESYKRLDMSRADQQRIDAWLELLRDTERGLEGAACDPALVDLDADTVAAASEGDTVAQAFTERADVLMQLMALTLACDVNRSLLLSFPGFTRFDWDGIHHSYDHDGLSHRTGSAGGSTCVEGVLDMLWEIDRWYAAEFAKLVKLLDDLPEADGSVLDNTALVWLQEFSDGAAMNLNNMPIVIAGSCGRYLKQGVAVNVEDAAADPGNSDGNCGPDGDGMVHHDTGSTGGNVPINKLYATLLNALGCQAPEGGPVLRFGQFDGFIAEEGIADPGELEQLKA